jgi:inner membrane protein
LKGSNHVVFGTILGMGTQLATGLPLHGLFAYPVYYGGVVLGSLLPDIDHPQAYLGRRIRVLSVPINTLFGHRGITHSFLFIGLLGIATAVWWAKYPLFFGGLFIGILSHLLGDMFTITGIPLFYPNKKRYGFIKKKSRRG